MDHPLLQPRQVAFRNIQPHDVDLDAQERDSAYTESEEDVFFRLGSSGGTGGEGGGGVPALERGECWRGWGGGEVDFPREEGDSAVVRGDLRDRVVFVVGYGVAFAYCDGGSGGVCWGGGWGVVSRRGVGAEEGVDDV